MGCFLYRQATPLSTMMGNTPSRNFPVGCPAPFSLPPNCPRTGSRFARLCTENDVFVTVFETIFRCAGPFPGAPDNLSNSDCCG